MTRERRYDVLVVGGGAGGVAAAVGAAQTGARTLLVEQWPHLGGAATTSNVLTYCGFFTQASPPEQVVGGVGEQVLIELRALGFFKEPYRSRRTGNLIIPLDPEATKYALDRQVVSAGLDVLLHTRLVAADADHGVVRAARCLTPGEEVRVLADAFVDASGDCALATAAGATVTVGTAGQLMTGTLMIRLGGVCDGVEEDREAVAAAIRRYREERDVWLARDQIVMIRIPGSGDLLVAAADETVNGMSADSLTRAEMSGRRQAWHYLEALRRYVPGCEGAYLASTGPKLGIRETRHVLGGQELTGGHARSAGRCADSVARCGWPLERHVRPGSVTYEQIAGRSYFDIPYGAIQARRLDNLWLAGRTISADRDAYASVRVMGTAFATGHAAGVAAASWLQHGRRHDVAAVRAELVRQHALI